MKHFIVRLMGIVLLAGISGCSSGAKEIAPGSEGADPAADQAKIDAEIKKSMEMGGYDKRGGKLPPPAGTK